MNVLKILITVPNVPNSDCNNTISSFDCICKSGYEMVDEKCNGYNKLQYLYYISYRIC